MAASMRLLAETEHVLASEIDKGLKNKWVWAWKDEIITTEVKGRKLSIRLGDSVQKLNVPGKAQCTWCNKVLGYKSRGKSVLKDHLTTIDHKTHAYTRSTNQTLGSSFQKTQGKEQPIFTNSTSETIGECAGTTSSTSSTSRPIVPVNDRICNHEAAVLAVIAEQSWSFAAAPVLVSLAKSLAADPEALSQMSMDRTSASYKMKYGLGESFCERTVALMQQQKFSLNIDEATSSNTARVLTLLVNVIDPKSKQVTTQHLVSLQLVRVDAESVFQAVDGYFEKKQIPWKNCMSILMDSCAVMRGSKSGFETRVRNKASHLLDIDGDVCHHVHNAAKKFCAVFKHWGEGLFSDIHTEFHWSAVNQDTLKEICFILGVKYTSPQNYIAHRWLSCYDAAQSTLIQLQPLTVYAFGLLNAKDQDLYRSIVDSICQDVSPQGRAKLLDLHSEMGKKSRTDDGTKRAARIVDKLFFHRMWTKCVLGVYSSVLGVMKEYVCLFQKDECIVHLLHDQQMTLFKQFLAMFVKPEAFHDLEAHQVMDNKQLDLKKQENLLRLPDMSVGASTLRVLSGFRAKDKLVLSFLETVQSGFTICGQYLQQKLPINNKVLQAMAAFGPTVQFAQSAVQLCLKSLPDIVTNVLTLTPQEDENCVHNDERNAKLDDKRDSYNKQVDLLCTSLSLPPREDKGKPVEVDRWWADVNKTGQYQLLYEMVSALLTCFHGPKVESSFSQMSDVLDRKSNRMHVSTFSSIQSVKYGLKASKTSAVKCFSRKDKVRSPVNYNLCRLLRGSHKNHVEEQAKHRAEEDAKRTALSLKKQELVHKKKTKAMMAEAEKKARQAHRKLMLVKLHNLSSKRQAACGSGSRKRHAACGSGSRKRQANGGSGSSKRQADGGSG